MGQELFQEKANSGVPYTITFEVPCWSDRLFDDASRRRGRLDRATDRYIERVCPTRRTVYDPEYSHTVLERLTKPRDDIDKLRQQYWDSEKVPTFQEVEVKTRLSQPARKGE